MAEPFKIPRGSLQPPLAGNMLTRDGTPQNITGATIVFTMWRADSGEIVINEQAVIVVDGPNGGWEFRWQGAQTQVTPGRYCGHVKVTAGIAGNLPAIWPSHRHIDIEVLKA